MKANYLMASSGLILLFFEAFLLPSKAYACEPCALFSASQFYRQREKSLTLGVSDQLTEYKSKSPVAIRDGERLKALNTTTFNIGYNPTQRLGLDLFIPYTLRWAYRYSGFSRRTKTDSGLGDVSALLRYSLIEHVEVEESFFLSIFAGVKLPTGSSSGLNREKSSTQLRSHSGASLADGQVHSFGTGSVDYFLGSTAMARLNRAMLYAGVQYSLNQEGDHNYRFANDFLWDVGPAYYLVLNDDYSVAGRLVFSGEHKGLDTRDGQKVPGTKVGNIYAGPQLIYSAGGRLSGELSFIVPIEDSSQQALVVPRSRLRASFYYRF